MSSITVELLSDATFFRGTGTAGEVDLEVAHDELGLPMIPARTLRGLLRESWLAILPHFSHLRSAARDVLGPAGDTTPSGGGRLQIDNAQVPDALRRWVEWAVRRDRHPVLPSEILRAFTSVRRQTARSRATGGPETGTLRASRVALRTLVLEAPIETPGFREEHWEALALACLGVRHAGIGRNRGRGHVRLHLLRDSRDVTHDLAKRLREAEVAS